MSPLGKNNKKNNRIRTLRDLGNNKTDGGYSSASSYHNPIVQQPKSAANTSHQGPMTFQNFRVCHIPTLPLANEALAMLQRVVKEFEPIIQRRGYNVRSVSEMDTSGDGLDYNENGERSKRRKKKIMPNNVLGYNQTTTRGRYGKSHTIHLRLRHSQSHDRLIIYEDVAGTMAHELAHCKIGPHNDAFNKLMDEILEEHMVLQCQKAGTGGFGGVGSSVTGSGPAFPGEGQALGGADKSAAGTDPRHPGYTLGGNAFAKFLSPREAACMAAEARRRQQKLRSRGQRCCQPCTITIPDNEDEEPIVDYGPGQSNGDNDKKKAARKRTNNSNNAASKAEMDARKKVPKTGGIIDLTEDSSGDLPKAASVASKGGAASGPSSSEEDWACTRCTFVNRPMALACSMCSLEKGPL